jgi:hypothetical protein
VTGYIGITPTKFRLPVKGKDGCLGKNPNKPSYVLLWKSECQNMGRSLEEDERGNKIFKCDVMSIDLM